MMDSILTILYMIIYMCNGGGDSRNELYIPECGMFIHISMIWDVVHFCLS